jgi:hypothetical protein
MASRKTKAENYDKPQPIEEKEPVKINTSQYRSMILSKLRSDIEAKRSAYEFAAKATPAQLQGMSYWKMAYWKMKYWKMGSIDKLEELVDPQLGSTKESQG